MTEGYGSYNGGEDLPAYNETAPSAPSAPHGAAVSTPDLDRFFRQYSYLPEALKDNLVQLGVRSLEKLLLMDDSQIMLFGNLDGFDKTLSSDLILLIGALKKHKKEKNDNNQAPKSKGTDGRTIGMGIHSYGNNSGANYDNSRIPLSTDAGPAPYLMHNNSSNNNNNDNFKATFTTTTTSSTMSTKITPNKEYNINTIEKNQVKEEKQRKEKVDRSGYGLIAIFGHLMNEMEEGNFNFALCWMIILGCNLFIFIYGGINYYDYSCPSNCDSNYSASLYNNYDCYSECQDITDSDYYYWYDDYYKCGYTSSGSSVYCERNINSTWQLLIALTPVCDWFLLFMYFLLYFRINILKAFFFAIFFIPMSIISFAFTVMITVMTSIASPILVAVFVSQSKNTGLSENGKKDYKDIDNNATHFHLIGAIIHNRDWKFAILWILIFGCSFTVLLINSIKLGENAYTCDGCITSCYSYNCDDSWDEGYSCGYDENGSTVYCEENTSSEMDTYRLYIVATYASIYLLITFLYICVCHAGFAKACILAIPTCMMLCGLAVPFTIVACIIGMFVRFICY